MTENQELYPIWVCRHCSHPCFLLYYNIEPDDDEITNCVVRDGTTTSKWKIEYHKDLPISQILNHYVPRPESGDVE
jgi:hypothetical protein